MNFDPLILVIVGNHFAVVQGDLYCCGITKKPGKIAEAKYGRKFIKQAWVVTHERAVDLDVLCPKPPVDKDFLLKLKAHKLAKAYGVEIQCDGPGEIIWVYPPDDLIPEGKEEELDPCFDEHSHDGWADALKAVETYVELQRTFAHKLEAFAGGYSPQDLAVAANPS